MKLKPQHDAALRELAENLDGQRFAMLTLHDEAGHLVSQPMTPQEMDEHGAIWMMVSTGATADRLRAGQAGGINLSFSDERRSRYVSISGHASVVDDLERKRELWSVVARPWFPGGPEDPSLLLIRVAPVQAAIWEGPSSATVRALAFAASIVAGEPVGLGEHQRVGIAPSRR
jgi:general stress protein 26